MSAVVRAGVLLILATVIQAGTPPAAAAEFFVELGQLAGDADFAAAENHRHIGERGGQAAR